MAPGGSSHKRKCATSPEKEPSPGSHKKQMQEHLFRSGKRAATHNINYDERAEASIYEDDGESDDGVAEAVYPECVSEHEAVIQTGPPSVHTRRLFVFELFDERQTLQPVEAECGPLFIRGVVQPIEGTPTKKTGREVDAFGPLVKWNILYGAQHPTIQIFTNDNVFQCAKPSPKYRPLFAHLREQAVIAHQVYLQLAPVGPKGDMGLTFEGVLQRLQRSKVKHGYCTWREALMSNAEFIMHQLEQMSAQHGKEGLRFEETPFGLTLHEECMHSGIMVAGGGICIDPGADQVSMTSDEILARQLQAKEEAKVLRADQKDKGMAQNGCSSIVLATEEDIADDYPVPTVYVAEEEETDEFLMADEDVAWLDPEYLPQRTLTDFAIYNSEGLLKTLELLPCWRGIPPTVELYGSGIVKEEEDETPSNSSQFLQQRPSQGGPSCADAGGQGSSSGAGGSGIAGSSSAVCTDSTPAMRVFLSQIQEYVVECQIDSVCIFIRTEASWYKLEQPSLTYAPWFNVVVKCARIAVTIIGMLLREARACKLSFADVSSLLAKEDRDSELFISHNASEVGKMLTMHGQFILNQFAHYPNAKIQNCAFVTHLREQLLTRQNCKSLLAPKRDLRRNTRLRSLCMRQPVNRNPMRERPVSIRAKSMPATATVLVQSIWKNYFSLKGIKKEVVKEEDIAREEDTMGDPDMTDCETEVGGNASGAATTPPPTDEGFQFSCTAPTELALSGDAPLEKGPFFIYSDALDEKSKAVKCGDFVVCMKSAKRYSMEVGHIELGVEEELLPADSLGMIQCFLKHKTTGKCYVQLRVVIKGEDTVLGDAASANEFFLTESWSIIDLNKISLPVSGICLRQNSACHASSREPVAQERHDDFIVKLVYQPEEGMFSSVRHLELGEMHMDLNLEVTDEPMLHDKETFQISNDEYSVGDAIYFDPGVLPDDEKVPVKKNIPSYIAASKREHKGSIRKMKPYGVGVITGLKIHDKILQSIHLKRYYRPEDVNESYEHAADFWEVFESDKKIQVKPEDIIRRCTIKTELSGNEEDTFVCTKRMTFNGNGEAVLVNLDLKCPKVSKTEEPSKQDENDASNALKTLDIFAGCGGLSEGMHQAGVADTKWAIEYDDAAAQAFRLNHPSASVLCDNVSALLCRIMTDQERRNECSACEEVEKQASKIPDDAIALMPKPGEVEFMVGGPPCQGYSGMNRFNKGQWSMMQNSMVMNYLSFADYYRPRYFLLENVRNFVSHNSSRTFRLTLRTLIDMGYQVRFGVLNAGNYGVPQSRKRTFVWAALPDEHLPGWPKPLHVFRSPQLTINLPGGAKYAVPHDPRGAPFRTVTVQDAISDLPAIQNGADKIEQEYTQEAVSAFQRHVRGDATVLRDHICKKLNGVNMERCRCIPKDTPGADWRTLLEIVAADPSREKFEGQPLVPWCLPNTAARHNNWRGLYGRLDKRGHFPTSTTDPQPMGKVGQVFHPEQDRIVSVRECARSQGFPDSYIFHGTIHQKHKQVGNAVPPPLACALGTSLKTAVSRKTKQEH